MEKTRDELLKDMRCAEKNRDTCKERRKDLKKRGLQHEATIDKLRADVAIHPETMAYELPSALCRILADEKIAGICMFEYVEKMEYADSNGCIKTNVREIDVFYEDEDEKLFVDQYYSYAEYEPDNYERTDLIRACFNPKRFVDCKTVSDFWDIYNVGDYDVRSALANLYAIAYEHKVGGCTIKTFLLEELGLKDE